MKKILAIIAFACALLVYARVGEAQYEYTIPATVCAVQGKQVTIKDKAGYLYTYTEDKPQVRQGDAVMVTMYNNRTSANPYDDEIVKVKPR